MTFADRLKAAVERNNSLLCVGLDPDPDLMGDRDVFLFNKSIIDATADASTFPVLGAILDGRATLTSFGELKNDNVEGTLSGTLFMIRDIVGGPK